MQLCILVVTVKNFSCLHHTITIKKPSLQVCGNSPHIQETEHLFLDLPKLKDKLEAYVEETSKAGGWSANSIQTTNAWIRDGLKPRCITRDLKWGVPVPMEKYKDKVLKLLISSILLLCFK